MKHKSKFTTIKNVILSLLMILAIGLDCWGLYIRFHGKDKVQSYIFKVGQQTAHAIDPVTGEETTEDRWFCEVNLYDNCYEILFNYFVDDPHTEFYSQGLQFYLPNDYAVSNFSRYMNENYKYNVGESLDIYSHLGEQDLEFYFSNESKTPIKNEFGVHKVVTDDKDKHKFLGIPYGRTNITSYYYNILSDKDYRYIEVNNYASANNYEDTIGSANPLNEDSYFRIQIEDEPYLMKMKGSNYSFLSKNDEFFLTENVEHVDETTNWLQTYSTYYFDDISYYRTCDPYYLAELIYNSCQPLDYSSDGIVITFEFGDLFDYFYDTEEIINDQNINDKIKNYITNYYQIKVNKFKGNMTSASQSLFKYFKGSQNYNEELAEDSEDSSEVFTDYHHGRTILELNENYFDYTFETSNFNNSVIVDGSNNVIQSGSESYKIYFKLKDEFKSHYTSTNGYRLRIKINLDNLGYKNAEFAGFVDGTFDDYSIYMITTYSTVSGELVEEDITLEVV